jgi:hypothetical protein
MDVLSLLIIAVALWVSAGMTILSVASRRNTDGTRSLALAAVAGPLTGLGAGWRR